MKTEKILSARFPYLHLIQFELNNNHISTEKQNNENTKQLCKLDMRKFID